MAEEIAEAEAEGAMEEYVGVWNVMNAETSAGTGNDISLQEEYMKESWEGRGPWTQTIRRRREQRF
jgi:hypothetical protein